MSWFIDYKIAFRRLTKEKKYSLINVGGLAIGMAAALLILLYVQFELSYDRYHENHQQIYRIGMDATFSGERVQMAINSVSIGPLMVDQMHEFTSFTRIFPVNFFFNNLIYRYEDKQFAEDGVLAADSTFFEFFEFDFIHGNAREALTEPYSVVMTESMAKRYFGTHHPYGEMIELEGAGTFRVTAVVSDPPANSHIQFDGLISMSSLYHFDQLFQQGFAQGVTWRVLEQSAGSRIVWVYLKSKPGFDPQEFAESRWPEFAQAHIDDISFFDKLEPIFQPIADIHLTSKLEYEMTTESGVVTMMSPDLIRIFIAIAGFLLVLASINYANITISQFNRRSKEVGVKKVMGAQNPDLVRQFFTESIVFTLLALVFALVLVEIFLPSVNNLLGVELTTNIFLNPRVMVTIIAVALFVGVVSGIYPAVYFSSFTPLKILQYRFKANRHSLKKILIIVQFTISVFMIIATVVVSRQLSYLTSKDLGFDHDRVVVVELKDETSRMQGRVLQNELLSSPYIEDAALSNTYPSRLTIFNSMEVEHTTGTISLSANVAQVSPDYLDFMSMEMKEGRFFSYDYPSDFHEAVVINEAAQKSFGWEDPIGKSVSMGLHWPDGTRSDNRRVIGVVKDFHFASLGKPIEPLVWYPMRDQGQFLNVRLSNHDYLKGLSAIENTWNEVRPNYPLERNFLSGVIASMYQSQKVLSIFFAVFAWVCIIIAFLGLFGLAAYSVEQRTREIGIRKVLGARLFNIIGILGREFTWLIVIAVIIACSLAWYFMTYWLSSFAYHTHMGLMPYVAGVLTAFATAFIAVTVHALRASSGNLTRALQYE